MKFSYSAVWDDTVAMLRANSALVLAIAGAFLFLPALLVGHFIPQPTAEADEALAAMIAYVGANWHWLLLANVVNMVGAIAILLLLLDGAGRTVGGAIAAALPLLPAYFVATMLSGAAVGLASLFLLIPGFYVFARFAPLGPVVVAERSGPLRALARCWELSKGKGWAIFLLVLIVALTGFIISIAISAVIGSILRLLSPGKVGDLLVLILNSFTSAVLSTVLIVLFAALYRALAPRETRGI